MAPLLPSAYVVGVEHVLAAPNVIVSGRRQYSILEHIDCGMCLVNQCGFELPMRDNQHFILQRWTSPSLWMKLSDFTEVGNV